MKLRIANHRIPAEIIRQADLPAAVGRSSRAGARRLVAGRPMAGFTMIEIALCLAIIGFALVSILLVLPTGMNTQRDTREETIIGEDASVLLEAIRSGARGMDELTNYVYAISIAWTQYNPNGTINQQGVNTNSFDWASINIPPTSPGSDIPSMHLTNGLRIIGLLSTPEYTDNSGEPIPGLNFGGISNHVIAYVRSFSGLATEKPPQNNELMRNDSFTYRLLCVNAPIPVDTNLFYLAPFWQSIVYKPGDIVFYNWDYWQALRDTLTTDVPGQGGSGVSPLVWRKVPNYSLELARSQRELRLFFMWPQLPNGDVGGNRQNFRTSVAGQLVATNYGNFFPGIRTLYFYQPETFSSLP